MDIVIDASALVAVIADEPERDALVQLTLGADLIAPHSVHWEIGNAFSAMLRRRRTTLTTVRNALAIYRQIPLRLVDVELEEALALAADLGIYAYDAYLIRCSLKYAAPLLSLDAGLIEHARRVRARVIEVSQ